MLLKGIGEVGEAMSAAQTAEMVLVRIAFAADLPPPGKIVRDLAEQRGRAASAPAAAGNGAAAPAPAPAAERPAPAPSGTSGADPEPPPDREGGDPGGVGLRCAAGRRAQQPAGDLRAGRRPVPDQRRADAACLPRQQRPPRQLRGRADFPEGHQAGSKRSGKTGRPVPRGMDRPPVDGRGQFRRGAADAAGPAPDPGEAAQGTPRSGIPSSRPRWRRFRMRRSSR